MTHHHKKPQKAEYKTVRWRLSEDRQTNYIFAPDSDTVIAKFSMDSTVDEIHYRDRVKAAVENYNQFVEHDVPFESLEPGLTLFPDPNIIDVEYIEYDLSDVQYLDDM